MTGIQHKGRNGPGILAAQAASLSIGFAGATLPALAQEGELPEPQSSKLVTPGPEISAKSSGASEREVSNRAVSRSFTPTLAETGLQSSGPSNAITTVSAALAMIAMGWYFRQIRTKETAVSIPSLGLQAFNDGLLAVTALVCNQGGGSIAVPAIFAAGGVLCLREAWRSPDNRRGFDRWNFACGLGCTLGWGCLIASWSPELATAFGQKSLEFGGSLVATATYLIAGIPIAREMLRSPDPKEIRSTDGHRWSSILKVTGPYIIGTIGLALALAVVPEFTWASATQPTLLLMNNIFLQSCLTIWALRRHKN